MPNCEKYREMCSASIDGELSKDEKRELNQHLTNCPACAAYLDDLREMRNAWGDFKEPLSDELHEKIMSAVMDEAKKQVSETKKTKRPFPVFTMLSAAAACVMLVLSGAVGDIIGNNTEDSQSKAVPSGNSAMEEVIQPPQGRIAPIAPQQEQIPQVQQTEPEIPDKQEYQQHQEEQQTETSEPKPQIQQEQTPAQEEAEKPKVNRAIVGQSPNLFAAVSNEQIEKNSAEIMAVTIPAQMQTSKFAFCLVAVGQGDIPVIDGAELIEKNNDAYYFKVTGVISDFDKSIKSLQNSGFETAMRTDLGVNIDPSASNGLLVLAANQEDVISCDKPRGGANNL